MYKNSFLNLMCWYSGFHLYENYTVLELILYASLSISCIFNFNESILEDDSIKRLRHSICKLIKIEDTDIVAVDGLISKCVESPICLSFHIQAFKERIAGAPIYSVCDVISND